MCLQKNARVERRLHQAGLLGRLQLLYTERHLHAREVKSGRVAPSEIASETKVEVSLSSVFRVELSNEKKGHYSESTIKKYWPEGGFVRGEIISIEDDGFYSVKYNDGPYARNDPRAPPPGYPRNRKDSKDECCRPVLSDAGNIQLSYRLDQNKEAILRHVPSKDIYVEAIDEWTVLYRPVLIFILILSQIIMHFIWWHQWQDAGRIKQIPPPRTSRSRRTPGAQYLFFQLNGNFPQCQDHRAQPWRLLTYQFVHVNYSHLLSNAIATLFFGIPLEITHGALHTFSLYQFGVIAGALLCTLTDSYDAVVGASGGTYALIGAHLGVVYKDWNRLKHGIFLDRYKRLFIICILLLADIFTWLATKPQNISYAAHLGGGFAGLLLAILILRRRKARNTTTSILQKLRTPAALLALLFFFSFFLFGFLYFFLVFPPRPISHIWYDYPKWKHRPCCIQLFNCGHRPDQDPYLFRDLACSYDKTKHIFDIFLDYPPFSNLNSCDDIDSFLLLR